MKKGHVRHNLWNILFNPVKVNINYILISFDKKETRHNRNIYLKSSDFIVDNCN